MLRTLAKPIYLGLREIVLRTVIRPGPVPPIPKTVQSLMVITDRRLGDVCAAIPTLQCLRSAYPDATLGVLAARPLHPLVQWACHANQLFDFEDQATIANQAWDLVMDLTSDYHLRAARVAARTGCPVRIGFDFKGRARYFNIPLQLPTSEPMTETYARTLAPLGISYQQLPLPTFIPSDPVRESLGNPIIIHPGAHHSTQRWPAEYFAELIRRIHGAGETCLVIGGETERDLVGDIVHRAGAGASAIPRDVMQLAATMRAAEVAICNNSGPLHLAAMLGRPTVSLMGPTLKARWTPPGNHHVVLRRDELPCIGCNLGYCRIRTHACMKDITPDDAFAAYFRLRALLLLESST